MIAAPADCQLTIQKTLKNFLHPMEKIINQADIPLLLLDTMQQNLQNIALLLNRIK